MFDEERSVRQKAYVQTQRKEMEENQREKGGGVTIYGGKAGSEQHGCSEGFCSIWLLAADEMIWYKIQR